MVKNPEKDNLETYDQIYSSSPYPHASVDRIVYWTLDGELEAMAEDDSVRRYFQNIIEKTNLDLDYAYSILARALRLKNIMPRNGKKRD